MPTIQENKEQSLIRPFKSKILKKPISSGFRVIKGEWSIRLADMGWKNRVDEDELKERREAFENHLRWDIAHRNYNVLKSCISIDEEYNEATQKLAYTIDLYGDESVMKKGQLHVNRGDYVMFYMRMNKYRRKEAILDRIALANVGVLVPYVWLDTVTYDDPRTKVQAVYRIVL
ncbi:hypothetical protein JUJ52_19685 [Virgibacillus sp. AGTR]|uniref:hypothetical protein n=1 Tax=Virgibacillus sp. AGTR TaxID=2812055 RepID=UPI001D1657B2|nr:hypothetical protein [Virgibacillus sp. AGTR]MCC2252155.1 hypothetical protein [Virgibacillus sp. AGTR]